MMGLFNKTIIHDTSSLENTLTAVTDRSIDTIDYLVKSKDRVDISLAEYKAMENKIVDLQTKLNMLDHEHRYLLHLFKTIGIAPEMIGKIIPDSLEVYENHDPMWLKKRVMIKFDMEDR
jgi:hypothetical protein